MNRDSINNIEAEIAARGVENLETRPLSDVLAVCPPGRAYLVEQLASPDSPIQWEVELPQLMLHCPSETCGSDRVFDGVSTEGGRAGKLLQEDFFAYTCRNCGAFTKLFAVLYRRADDEKLLSIILKMGEFPPFGPVIPSRLVSILRPNHELFVKGRRAESQGMGIAAFAYYRRVVEDQKARLLDQIIKVARLEQAPADRIAELEQAQSQKQFSQVVELMKDATPDSLRLEGENPLRLLHSALSDGLHNLSDDDCLSRAANVRIILVKMTELLEHALKDRSELKTAIQAIKAQAAGTAKQ